MAKNSFSRWKYAQVDCFIASCAAIRERLALDGINRARIVVVHDGVDVDWIDRIPGANIHAEFYLPTHAPIIGNVAALVPHKGHQHLVDAAALVLRDIPDARFVIIGEGEVRGVLERHIRNARLERHVLLAGFRADVLELTKGFDVFAMSSLHEGLCIALVDAMAAGRPAVATRAGGIPEVLVDGETGFLVEPRDHRSMAARLVHLLKDGTLRTRMGVAAQARAREHFTVDRMVRETAAVHARVAARRAPPPGAGKPATVRRN